MRYFYLSKATLIHTIKHTVFLLLGSNQQNPSHQLEIACNEIALYSGSITERSSIYSTAAWGQTEQPDFLNQVLKIETYLNPQDLLIALLSIERKMGRIRTEKYAPRIIDIDILFYEATIINEPELIIPHPQIPFRRFVLVPFCEIAPNFIHPEFHKKMSELLDDCADPLAVQKYRP